jgi:anaerobic ribonucleoside-triphosphate reductase activating protein
MTAIHVAKVHVPVTALGPGRRVGIWLQGCSIGCRECVSQDTWPSSIGETSVAALLSGVTAALRADATLTGVTISGGEPLEQAVAMAELLAGLRAAGNTELDVLLYTGFAWRRALRDHAEVLSNVDAVIPEPFVAALAPGQVWRGSSNQPLMLLTELAVRRYRDIPARRPFQVVVEDGRLYTIGVPAPGDLDRALARARTKGLAVAEVSWRS